MTFDPASTALIGGKFVIFAAGQPPEGLAVAELTPRWSIALDDDLALVEVLNGSSRIGWMMGVVIDLDTASIVQGSLVIDAGSDGESEWQEICRRCAGSWLFLADRNGEIELRPDADATVGAVFDPEARRIASYAYLLAGDDYGARLLQNERSANQVERDGWFTGGQTAHEGIFRLLPNHRLGTADFEQRRIPLEMPVYRENVKELIGEIATELATVVKALLADRPTNMGLTGGNETRAILAALRGQADALQFVTFDFPTSKLDTYLAKRLTRFAGLRHSIHPQVEAQAAEKEVWLLGAGHAMAGANKDFFPTTRPLSGEFLVGGLGGEVGRGFLWPPQLKAGDEVTPLNILSRLKQPETPQNVAAITHWHAQLPEGLDAFQLLDLAYLELRMGPWAFAQPRMRVVPRSIHPLISYNQFRRMWSLPPDLRAADKAVRIMIEQHWPELLQIPINKYGDWRDVRRTIWRAVSRPDRVVRKLRQVLARKPRRLEAIDA